MGIKQFYNDNLQKLPNDYGDVSVLTVHVRVFKFRIRIPHGKIADTRLFFFFLSELSPFLELCPFEKKNQNGIWCMPHLMNRACYDFEISCMDSAWKNNWPVFFFFLSDVSPFLELCPFEKIRMKSCQQDISKIVWARGLKLGQLIGDGK